MSSWMIFILLWITLGMAALFTKKLPFVSLLLAAAILGGCGYMISIGENGGAIVTALATIIVLILRFIPDKRQEA